MLPDMPESEPLRVFISTDMSADDVVAVLYLVQHPGVQVLGIGSSNGVAHVEPAAKNVLRLLAMVGQEDVPVAVGSDAPPEGDHTFPSAWRQGADRLFGLSVAEARSQPVSLSTAELLADVVNAHSGEVVVILLGAHTDLAMALRTDPGLAQRIKGVHLMGGAVHVPGNIHAEYSAVANESAEWNLWLDYRAAAEVFASGIPLTLVPLDATNKVRVDGTYIERFGAEAESPAAKVVTELWRGQSASFGSFHIWDVVAAVALTLPDAAQWEEDSLAVVTDKANHLGQTLLQAGQPANARVCLSVDVPSLRDELIRVLNR
jgi:inosine-uridine nucleoside N-ribohydrolase